jgi:Holliday junction resolvase
VFTKRKGYRVERKIRILFEQNGWIVIRAGASLGEADLICLKQGKCILLQIKSTKKKIFYYYGWMKDRLENFPFYLVVDFGYGKIRILKPRKKTNTEDGVDIKEFLYKK